MYLGPLCYDYALNGHLVYLAAYQGHASYAWKGKICLFYLYVTAKSEIQICTNKHETGLVDSQESERNMFYDWFSLITVSKVWIQIRTDIL